MTAPVAPPAQTERLTRRTLALLALVLLLALGLRLWQLDQHVLWWDEGNNAYFAHQTPAQILEMSRLTNDTNPPAHRLALALWLRLLGDSAFNLRLLSVVCGVLTVGLAFVWGRRLGGDGAGLLAALLLALSPTAIYYSREAKGYPWVTLWEWVALTLLVRATEPKGPQQHGRSILLVWAGYVLASALAVGAHYYALFVHLAQGVWLLAMLASQRPGWRAAWHRLWPWALAQVAVLALVAPWTVLTWGTAYAGAEAIPPEANAARLGPYLASMLTQLTAGLRAAPLWGWMAAISLLSLAVAALRDSRREAQNAPLFTLLAALVLVPVLAGYLFQRLAVIVIARFFLFVVPALCILAALGLARLRWKATPVVLALAIAWGLSLPGAYASPAPEGEDLRDLAATLDTYARPGDVVVVNYIWQEGMLQMYAPKAPVVWELGWYTDENVSREMERLFSTHERLWLMTYEEPLQHPSNQAGWWLEQQAVRALDQRQGHTRLALYVAECSEESLVTSRRFANGIELTYATDNQWSEPGRVVTLALRWTLEQPIPEGTMTFLQLLAPDGSLAAQSDGHPVNDLAPLWAQATGDPVQDCRAILVPTDAPPGDYTMISGLYDRATGARVPVEGADGAAADLVVLGHVIIDAP